MQAIRVTEAPNTPRDIITVISEGTMEQIVIRNLPLGTKAALRRRADAHHRSMEAEAREILRDALAQRPAPITDLLFMDDGLQVEFEPDRLGLGRRELEL